jgi:hypothetical protein
MPCGQLRLDVFFSGPSCSFRPLPHVTATFRKPSVFFRAYEIGGESRSVWLSIQSKPENVMEAKIAPRSPHRRGRQTKQAKDRQARRLGSWSVLPDDVGFSREVRYSAALMRYLNSRIQSCYFAPIIWVFAPKNRETERLTLAMGDVRGLPPSPVAKSRLNFMPVGTQRWCAMWRRSNTEAVFVGWGNAGPGTRLDR